MKIVAHRGFWLSKKEQNSLKAIKRAIINGYGIEIDVRDRLGEIVISHDPAKRNALTLKKVLAECAKLADFRKVVFAINIKSAGLNKMLFSLLKKYQILRNSFVFDMSIPDHCNFVKFTKSVPSAVRHSDIEKEWPLYRESSWVWLDEMKKGWIDEKAILLHYRRGKKVCIVSPELHKRNFNSAWNKYLKLPSKIRDSIALCTDYPKQAEVFFNGGRKK